LPERPGSADLEAPELLDVGGSKLPREEAIVAAAAAGVTHHDDTQELWIDAGIPQPIVCCEHVREIQALERCLLFRDWEATMELAY
jgi:hypothetical protein